MDSMKRLLLLAVTCLAAGAAAAQTLPYAAAGQHLGTVTCANSLCHGSITTWKDSNILQNEYVTWSRVDKHATKAYRVLFDARSKRIVANLGYREPAHQVKICLDCHAHNPPAARRGERFVATDGITCEACHGPAEGWVKSHVAPDATHARNLADGLYPTSDPVAQARLCLSCHFGNRDKFVTHRIMGAGHPRMSFELDTFTQTQPPHFVVDADWEKRKGEWDPVRVWAIGQALAAAETLDVLLDPKRSRDGLFPELVVFDCHACHHPMSQVRWSPKLGTSPGRIRFNDANLQMVRQIARRALPAADAKRFEADSAALHRAIAGDGGDALEAAKSLRATLDGVMKRLAERRFGPADLKAMLVSLVGEGLEQRFHDYADAEQATMAIASLLQYTARTGQLRDVRGANAALDQMHLALKNDEAYRPERFRAALAGLGRIVGN